MLQHDHNATIRMAVIFIRMIKTGMLEGQNYKKLLFSQLYSVRYLFGPALIIKFIFHHFWIVNGNEESFNIFQCFLTLTFIQAGDRPDGFIDLLFNCPKFLKHFFEFFVGPAKSAE